MVSVKPRLPEAFILSKHNFKKSLKPIAWAFFILFLLIGQIVMAIPASAEDDPPAVYISYTAASDNHTHVGGVYWSAQTFLTDNTTAISVTSISISLFPLTL